MKWSESQVKELKGLCMQGISNKDIAAKLGCRVEDVYNKRSQLKITIDKCKAPSAPAVPVTKPATKPNDVQKAFEELCDAILIEMAKDSTTTAQAKQYVVVADTLIFLSERFQRIQKGE